MKKVATWFIALSLLCGIAYAEMVQPITSPIGSLAIRISVLNSQRRPFGNYYDLRIEGSLINQTKVDIDGVIATPIFHLKNGGTANATDIALSKIVVLDLKSGASKNFKVWDSMSPIDLDNVETIDWDADIKIKVAYSFIHPGVEKQLPGVKAKAVVGSQNIGIEIQNDSDDPVEIVWNESSIIDIDRTAQRVFHVGVKYNEREQSLPNTVIPPLAKIQDEVTPTQNVYFIEGTRYSKGG